MIIRRRAPRFGKRRPLALQTFRSLCVTLSLCLYLTFGSSIVPIGSIGFIRNIDSIDSNSGMDSTSELGGSASDLETKGLFGASALAAPVPDGVTPNSTLPNPQVPATPAIPPELTIPPSAFTEAIEQAIQAIQDKNPGLAQNAGDARPVNTSNLNNDVDLGKGGRYNAVVRIIVVTPEGIALGSGSLIAVSKDYGLVLTNWHVVGGAKGPIVVAFPGGYRSQAKVLKTDEMWDLAAIAIWRPPVNPLTLSQRVPAKGDRLRIVGYGDGTYRCVEGVCTQFVAPDPTYPFEMLELSVAARHGDSGGPILNDRDEIAGVLFGAADNCTTGSHCGRVANFLHEVMPLFQALPEGPLPEAQPQKIAGIPRPEPMIRASELPPETTHSSTPPLPDTPNTDTRTNAVSAEGDATEDGRTSTPSVSEANRKESSDANNSAISETDTTGGNATESKAPAGADLAQDTVTQTAEVTGLHRPDSKSDSGDSTDSSPSPMSSDVSDTKSHPSDGTQEANPPPQGSPSPVLIMPSDRSTQPGHPTTASSGENGGNVDSADEPLWLRCLHFFFNRPIYDVVRDILAIIGSGTVLRYLVRTAMAERRRRYRE